MGERSRRVQGEFGENLVRALRRGKGGHWAGFGPPLGWVPPGPGTLPEKTEGCAEVRSGHW